MGSKIVAFDLDDVLCYRNTDKVGAEKYRECKPIPEMIGIANACYDAGMTIVVYTARGMCTFEGDVAKIYSNLFELTTRQLEEWGVKYHQLIMGKAHYDLLIDDKAIDSLLINSIEDVKRRLAQ
jgi:histidinol phosphatase-like enzyme|tara:strand:+ start:4492 stop:4863 length:372 start_codon:yes stop_codon:yes gene_type:complete